MKIQIYLICSLLFFTNLLFSEDDYPKSICIDFEKEYNSNIFGTKFILLSINSKGDTIREIPIMLANLQKDEKGDFIIILENGKNLEIITPNDGSYLILFKDIPTGPFNLQLKYANDQVIVEPNDTTLIQHKTQLNKELENKSLPEAEKTTVTTTPQITQQITSFKTKYFLIGGIGYIMLPQIRTGK